MLVRTIKSTLLASAFAGAMIAPAAFAQQQQQQQQQQEPAPAQEAAPMPYAQPDNSWITISGTLTKPTANSFLLNYGAGDIIVELDDWDGWNQTMGLKDGDEVQVTGRIDKDLLETTSIEASAVVDQRTGERHYASDDDEEDLVNWFNTPQSAEFGQTTMRGSVQAVNAAEGEFTLNNGVFEVQVDTGQLEENPLTAEGSALLKVGDIVTVIGVLDDDMFEKREIQATSLNVLTPDSIKLETSAEVQTAPAEQQTASVSESVEVAQVEDVPGAPPAQGEAWVNETNEVKPEAYSESPEAVTTAKADPAEAEAEVEVASATASSNADVVVTLPPEVEMAAEKEGYTTEDLAKAQLAALESAPPLNP